MIDMMGIIPTAAQLVAAREEIADVEAREGRAHLDSWVARFLAFGVRGGGAGEHPTTEWMALAMVYADMVTANASRRPGSPGPGSTGTESGLPTGSPRDYRLLGTYFRPQEGET